MTCITCMYESHPSSSFFFSEKKELFGLVVMPCCRSKSFHVANLYGQNLHHILCVVTLSCRFYIGQKANIVISDLYLLKDVTVKHFDNFHDRTPLPNVFRKAGIPYGLVSAQGNSGEKFVLHFHQLSPLPR